MFSSSSLWLLCLQCICCVTEAFLCYRLPNPVGMLLLAIWCEGLHFHFGSVRPPAPLEGAALPLRSGILWFRKLQGIFSHPGSLLWPLVTKSICWAMNLCWTIPINPVLDLTLCVSLFAKRACRSARVGLDLVCQGEKVGCWDSWIGRFVAQECASHPLVQLRWRVRARSSKFLLETPLGSLKLLCQFFISTAL